MPSKKRVTHRDVARMAGVSTAVVSYVINDGPRATSLEARRRVLDAIQTLSYHPSAAARGLRLQQTHTIGFISYDYYPGDAFFAPYNAGVLTGLTTALLAKRHYILPFPIGIGADLRGLHELLHSGRVDGVVVRLSQEPPITDSLLDMMAAAG
ncbi:MAG TPA: LacI family DNA-binding transcriptional regulator, partial [Chloroflexota bacterium]|nr:LacI family DNA-binding transcriptional regulator [Chloroflexota bacterium]